MYTPCSPVSIAMTSRSAHIFHRCSSKHIFCSKHWRFSYVSFMRTACARQNGTYFHCGVTLPSYWPYMIMKSLQCPRMCSSCNSSINSWMLFQYTRSPTTVEYVAMSDCLFLQNDTITPFSRRFYCLKMIQEAEPLFCAVIKCRAV